MKEMVLFVQKKKKKLGRTIHALLKDELCLSLDYMYAN
jgi:hypothetical protein